MKADTLSPFKIFGYHVQYAVPLFQRPYVWTREKQWEPLWSDISQLADALLYEQERIGDADVPPHFFGAIVLDQKSVPTGNIQTRHVIDGQQRLTTIQLLLNAAQRVVRDHGSPSSSKALGQLVTNDREVANHDDEVFKVWPTNFDRDAFRAVMLGEGPLPASVAKSPIAVAHALFVEWITEWAEVDGDPDKVAHRLGTLHQALTHYLRFVVIDLEPGDNAQVIFETLNDRGTPLLAADLVKNLVFQEAAADGLSIEELYHGYWEPFDSNAWRRLVARGRGKRPRIDLFLRDWLSMRIVDDVSADHLFSEFKTYLRSLADPAVMPVIADIVETSEVFQRLEMQPPTSPEGTFIYRLLTVMEQNVWGPVLLWLFSWPDDRLPPEERSLFLRGLESWSVRRMLTRQTMKGLNRTVFDVLEQLSANGPEKAGTTLVEYLAAQTADSSLWPDDEAVIDACLNTEFYRLITRARLRMVLEALEDSMRGPKSEQEHCPRGSLTIEHILPQGWREHWPLADGANGDATAVRDRLRHTLGNLTLVTQKLNSSASNRPWTDREAQARVLGKGGKRSILSDHTVLRMNTNIIRENPEKWNDADIRLRSRHLAERILTIWPEPQNL